ncbi:MAG: hypothetical protein IPM92_08680 [Saprospiraceae bacterium]|nr:hypothetical protein [Saprospiraceae bacterium]
MIVSLYGLPDEKYFEWRKMVLEYMSELDVDFQFEECTSLENILGKGIKDVPCMMIGNTIVDYKKLATYNYENF